MKTISIAKAGPVTPDRPIPDLLIHLNYELDLSKTEKWEEIGAVYLQEAQRLSDALHEYLPGGTLQRLLGLMQLRAAGFFTVPLAEIGVNRPVAGADPNLTPAQALLVALDLRKREVQEYYENLEEAVRAVAKEVGVGGYFQASDGTVYKIVEPEGRFVQFKTLDFVRTKREGEERGTLSMKEAQSWLAGKAALED